MKDRKSHLLYTKNPEGTKTFRYSQRNVDTSASNPDSDKIEINETDLSSAIEDFEIAQSSRRNNKNPNLNIAIEVDCIEITFWGWFNSTEFEISYRQNFGLSPLSFTNHNTTVLFAVIDPVLFKKFITQTRSLSYKSNGQFNPILKYIKDFKYRGSETILSSFKPNRSVVYFNLIDNIELQEASEITIKLLTEYFEENNIDYRYYQDLNQFEVLNTPLEKVLEVANNFDAVQSINSQSYLITKPSRFGTNIKELAFALADVDDNLPVIGVIDTGVSSETILGPLLVNDDNSFGLNGMNPRIDDVDGGFGHGTSVAALIALGDQLAGDIQATLFPHAKILSLKVLNDFEGALRNSDVADLIRRANNDYGVKMFNLSICYSDHLQTGQSCSDYAYLLDKLAFELDILIFICTANGSIDQNTIHDLYPDHFLTEENNFCTPADSMNNITVGALGDNLEPELPITVSKYPFSSSILPAPYTRKFHLDYTNLKVKNRNVVKPDVIYSGGNYTCVKDDFGIMMDSSFEAGLQILSANSTEPIVRGVGTSYATPLVANIGAKLAFLYPSLKSQSIKALIINNSEGVKFSNPYGALQSHDKKHISGHGKPNFEDASKSTDDEVTIVFEGKIQEGMVISLPLKTPAYLNDMTTKNSVISVTSTLCYRFLPVPNNQLAYCPVNIAFGFFNNVAIEESEVIEQNGRRRTIHHGISGGPKNEITLSDIVWSQDAFGRSKMLSNTQKHSFNIKKSKLISNKNIIKVGVQCHFHKNLPDYVTLSLPQEYEFSLVVKISENSSSDQRTGMLYEEIKTLNDLRGVNDLGIENIAEADI